MQEYKENLTLRGFVELHNNVGRHNAGIYLNPSLKRAVKIISRTTLDPLNPIDGNYASFIDSFFSEEVSLSWDDRKDLKHIIWNAKDGLQEATEHISNLILNDDSIPSEYDGKTHTIKHIIKKMQENNISDEWFKSRDDYEKKDIQWARKFLQNTINTFKKNTNHIQDYVAQLYAFRVEKSFLALEMELCSQDVGTAIMNETLTPRNILLMCLHRFECSYWAWKTFGAWNPDWKVDNYAYCSHGKLKMIDADTVYLGLHYTDQFSHALDNAKNNMFHIWSDIEHFDKKKWLSQDILSTTPTISTIWNQKIHTILSMDDLHALITECITHLDSPNTTHSFIDRLFK